MAVISNAPSGGGAQAGGSQSPNGGGTALAWQLVRTITHQEWDAALAGSQTVNLWTPGLGDVIANIVVSPGFDFNDVAATAATIGPFAFTDGATDVFLPALQYVVGWSQTGLGEYSPYPLPLLSTDPGDFDLTKPRQKIGYPVIVGGTGTPSAIGASIGGGGFSGNTDGPGIVNGLYVYALLSRLSA